MGRTGLCRVGIILESILTLKQDKVGKIQQINKTVSWFSKRKDNKLANPLAFFTQKAETIR